MMNVLITGDRGFIAGYLIQDLLKNGYKIWGIDNDWKYGKLEKSFDNNPNYTHITGDAKDFELLKNILVENKIDVFVMGAAIIGGISMFHELAYFLLSENEKITASSFDAAIYAHTNANLKYVVSMSSSMVYESTDHWPSKENDVRNIKPPLSTYGFQKLSTEYFCQGAWEQYKLPFKIVRPFNAVGIGEQRAIIDKDVMSGNIKLAMSHVIPDIIQKIYKKQYPLHLLGTGEQIRHYTYAGDLAIGIRKVIESDDMLNNSVNISTPIGHTVLELSKIIWNKMEPNKPFEYISDKPYIYDVQCRIPDTTKMQQILNFKADTSIEASLDEVIPWVKRMCDLGKI